jgi:transposase-like protein
MARTIEPTQLTSKTDVKQEPLMNEPGFLYQAVKKTIQDLLEAEMTAFLGAESRERTNTRRGYRSGHRPRSLKTRVGRVWFDLPSERSGEFKTKLFDRYQRSEQAFLLALQEMYLQGVSTRRVQKITETLCSLPISASEVSRLTVQMDQTLEVWRRRRLTEPYFALIVDARYEYVRADHRVSCHAIITTTGISDKTGQREILGVYVVNTENETSWTDALRDLVARGLRGVQIVTSDAHEGLVSALNKVFQGVLWQHCQRHYSQNARDRVYKGQRKGLTQDLRSIFDACDLAHAEERTREVVTNWGRGGENDISEWISCTIDHTLSCFHFPPSFRSRLRTTNMQERFNEELNRRSEVIRIFPNIASCLRLVTAKAMEQNEEWAEQRPYLDIRELRAWERAQASHVPAPSEPGQNNPPEPVYCRTFGT